MNTTTTIWTPREVREVEVEFDVHGGWFAGTYEEPPEWPEVVIAHVWLTRNGKRRDVLARLTDEQILNLDNPCLLAAENERFEAEAEARIASREYDDVPF